MLLPKLKNSDTGFDPDAWNYIKSVEVADGQKLENGTRKAITDFVKGCKTDNIWDAIKASCILCGARTLSGALTPLVGSTPTNFGFVSGDYDRKTGLKGDGVAKYLSSNRNNNADPRNNNHNALYLATPILTSGVLMGAGFADEGTNSIVSNGNCRNRTGSGSSGVLPYTGKFIGVARNNSSNYTVRKDSANTVTNRASETPFNGNIFVFRRNTSYDLACSAQRISFYSIGEYLDLALLENRLANLVTNINNAF